MSVEALPEETILSPFLQKLSRSAPFLFMGVLIFGALAWRPTTAPIELETLASAWHMHLRGARCRCATAWPRRRFRRCCTG